MTMADTAPTTLATLGADLRRDSWELAVEVVEEGLRDESFASLAQLGRAAQLGDMATFIAELGREIAQPAAVRLDADGPLAEVVRGHAGAREALGFGPREVVTEFVLMRRVLQRYVSTYADLAGDDLLEVEERLNDSIDRLAVECVGAYFDRATADSFLDLLVRELERARRYERSVAVVLLGVGGAGPQSEHLRGVARSTLRGSDIARRIDDETIGVVLLEADRHAADRFLRRLRDQLEFSCSSGAAHYPTEADDAVSLMRLAAARQLDTKRAR
jgi:hypothetical protein